MSYITKYLNQKAIYWGNPSDSGWGGKTFDDPVELDVRWEDREELYRNKDGVQEVSRAIVYLDQDVVVDGYLYLGELSVISSSEEGNPASVDGAFIIKAFRKIPELKGTRYERKAWL